MTRIVVSWNKLGCAPAILRPLPPRVLASVRPAWNGLVSVTRTVSREKRHLAQSPLMVLPKPFSHSAIGVRTHGVALEHLAHNRRVLAEHRLLVLSLLVAKRQHAGVGHALAGAPLLTLSGLGDDELFTFVGRKNASISSRRSSARGAASRAGRQPYPAMKRCYRRRWVKRHGHFSIAPTASAGMPLWTTVAGGIWLRWASRRPIRLKLGVLSCGTF